MITTRTSHSLALMTGKFRIVAPEYLPSLQGEILLEIEWNLRGLAGKFCFLRLQ